MDLVIDWPHEKSSALGYLGVEKYEFFKNCQVQLHLACYANCWASILVLGFIFVVKCS